MIQCVIIFIIKYNEKRNFGLRERTLRLSVGIEDIDDLIKDITLALEQI